MANIFKLTSSQKRNLVMCYLFPYDCAVNSMTWQTLFHLGLVEKGWTQDPRLPYERPTALGRQIADSILSEHGWKVERDEG